MHLLQSGVEITVIALWLEHEGTATTHRYIEANLALTSAQPPFSFYDARQPIYTNPRFLPPTTSSCRGMS